MLSLAVLAASLAMGALAADDMGPAAFLWPSDRVWAASVDNTAPCGSSASAGNRTNFPLTNGFLSLVDQDEAYDVQLSISYSDNPTSNSDFEVIVSSSKIAELNEGHTCISVPDAISNMTVGANATFQVRYEAAWDTSDNETYYACADVTYIEYADFTESYYCFNATISDDDDDSSSSASTTTSSSTTATATTTSSASTSTVTLIPSSSSISKGAIAGAVVGSICGAAILGAAALFLYRLGAKHQQQLLMRQHIHEMTLAGMNKGTTTA